MMLYLTNTHNCLLLFLLLLLLLAEGRETKYVHFAYFGFWQVNGSFGQR